MKKLTISIVNYNAGRYLISTLQSINKVLDEAAIEVVVSDNASTDGSFTKAQKLFPQFHYLVNKINLGFSKAHNKVLRKATTEYILITNPDVVFYPGVIKRMMKFMGDHQEVGAATCKVVFPDGKVDLTAHRGFPTPWASFLYYFLKNDLLYHMTNQDMTRIHQVDAITGAFFFTRKSVLDKVGFFDENFFMYGEDIDLYFRIKQAGFKVMYLPTAEIIHYKGVSSGLKKHSQKITSANLGTKTRSVDAFYQSMKIFYKKHYQGRYPFFINWLVFLGINIRWWLANRKLTV